MPVVQARKTCKSFREADFVTIWHSLGQKDAPLGGLTTLQVLTALPSVSLSTCRIEELPSTCSLSNALGQRIKGLYSQPTSPMYHRSLYIPTSSSSRSPWSSGRGGNDPGTRTYAYECKESG